MKLSAVGNFDDSEPGSEMADALRQLSFSSVYIDSPTCRVDLIPISAWYLPKIADPAADMRRFLDLHRPDIVVTWGKPPHVEFVRTWKERGVRWVHVVHWDLFGPDLDIYRYAKLIAPNQFCKKSLQEHGMRSVHLPVPVDTDRFAFRVRTKAEAFLSIYGHGGPHHRRSLPEIFLAWWEMADAPPLLVKARELPLELDHCLPPETAKIEVLKTCTPEDLYGTADVAIQVSRYESVGMSILEAMSCGIPVVTTKAEPMSEIAPELLVELEGTIQVRMAGKNILASVASVPRLKEKVQSLRGKDISALSRRVRAFAEERFSWKTLREQWINSLK